ncbi:MAG: metallophosphoesterase [Actinomycetota bacterium]|nr:metallophosphoesterase [Actinomycetota bacterium]
MKRISTRVIVAIAALMTVGAVAVAQAATSDTFGKSTVEQRIVPDSNAGFRFLGLGAGEGYTVRDGSEGGTALGAAAAGREKRRTPLSYFGQLTDFQLADEESPARVEFLDPMGGSYTSSWRPNEAFTAQEADAMIRQFNHFADNAPNRAGNGAKPKMDFVVNTGDVSDNNQYNETKWNLELMEGGTINPGSGVDPADFIGKHPLCPAGLTIPHSSNPTAYTGVQDRSLWPAPTMGYFWDPNEPNPTPVPANPQFRNDYADAPSWPGLMNQAQKPFEATGLKVPGYIVFGNHDGLVQGNVYGNQIFNQIATGCLKPVNDDSKNSGRSGNELLGFVLSPGFTSQQFLDLYANQPDYFMPVPPDPDRRLISKKELMDIYKSGTDPNGHGFGFVDAAEAKASNGSAGYYSWSPRRGVRYIAIDTHSEGGKVLQSDKGNLDTPQFNWLESKLKLATQRNEVAIVFSHHAASSMTADVPDENAPPCASVDPTVVTGCDADPRSSAPIKFGSDVSDLLLKYPAAIAWVAGHSHVNDVTPNVAPGGKSGYWSVRTAALADWPKQNRLLELFDNRDGNLSLFGTVIDHAAQTSTPAAGTGAGAFDAGQLASIGRTVGYNDSQKGGRGCGASPCGEGNPEDRNVELLIKDPRKAKPIITSIKVKPKKRKLKAGKKMKLTVTVSNFSTATAAAKTVRVALRSSNPRVKVKRVAVIKRINPGKTARVRVVVRATRKAKGRAKITARTAGKKAVAKLNIKKLKPKKKKRNKRR